MPDQLSPDQLSPEYMPDQLSPEYMPDQLSPNQLSPENMGLFTPQTPEGTPPPSKGGAYLFNNPYMNETFHNLSGGQKAQILQIPLEQRENVMNEIMRKGAMLQNPLTNPLTNAFNVLPPDKKMIALQGGYSSMAKEFNNLAKQIPDSLVTINKPVPMAITLAQQLPLFAVEQKGGKNTSSDTNDTSSSDTSNDTSSSSTNDTSSSDSSANSGKDGGIRIVNLT